MSDDIACEVLEGETVEVGHADSGALLRYSLGLDGVTEVWHPLDPEVQMEQAGSKRVVAYRGAIVGTITLLDDLRSYVKVFPDGVPVASLPDV
jgi:hypothetical protein